MNGTFVWGAPQWVVPVIVLLVLAAAGVAYAYRRAPGGPLQRYVAPVLKLLAIGGLTIVLLEPLFHGVRPRPGANLFVLMADNSASLSIRDPGRATTRGEQLKQLLDERHGWATRLGQDFDVRRYVFDTRFRSVADFRELGFEGEGSLLGVALRTLKERLRGRPVAGILLVTDGNATDVPLDDVQLMDGMPPIFPVTVGMQQTEKDIRIERVAVSQANFQAAPVSIQASIAATGYAGRPLIVRLLDEQGTVVESQEITCDDKQLVHVRFRTRPEESGLVFYRVEAMAKSAAAEPGQPLPAGDEATTVNNSRLVQVDQGHGPYRVLYVCGRPNWEFKFLRRAIERDEEIDLVGLVRIARREPKFDFRGRAGESSNPLYRGFENQDAEEIEQYDQPVLLRLAVEDASELRDGFPKLPEDLFAYHALILDDLDAEFFTADQMALVEQFVSHRGGGLLMLGGQESFTEGQYHRTPIGDLLPVYLAPHRPDDAAANTDSNANAAINDPFASAPVRADQLRLQLTREGWLQPWVRVRGTEEEERQRLAEMPPLRTLNHVSGLKPGASVLMHAVSLHGDRWPALAIQNFGRGRTAALLIGDLWRWGMHRSEDSKRNEFEDAWQQTVRWLVADVPRRVDVQSKRLLDQPGQPVQLQVQVRDKRYQPLDNAQVKVVITRPDGSSIDLMAAASDESAGQYVVTYIPRGEGAYRARVSASDPDGELIESRETGWVAEPAMEEFRRLQPDEQLLAQLAERSGGEVIEADKLQRFVASLPNRKLPVVEPWVYPLWHRWPVLALVLGCLVGEWSLRRLRGMP